MSKELLLPAFLLILNANLLAADKPNFTGYWVIDKDNSQVGERGFGFLPSEMAIIHDDNKLEIVQMMGESADKLKLTLDGKECKSEIMGRERISTASWSQDRKSITIASKMAFGRGEMTSDLNLKLTRDTVLVMDYASKSPFGDRKAILVFTRVD